MDVDVVDLGIGEKAIDDGRDVGSLRNPRIALMSSGVQPSPVGSVKCVPLSVSTMWTL
jgi:hypothetical protein